MNKLQNYLCKCPNCSTNNKQKFNSSTLTLINKYEQVSISTNDYSLNYLIK